MDNLSMPVSTMTTSSSCFESLCPLLRRAASRKLLASSSLPIDPVSKVTITQHQFSCWRYFSPMNMMSTYMIACCTYCVLNCKTYLESLSEASERYYVCCRSFRSFRSSDAIINSNHEGSPWNDPSIHLKVSRQP